MKVQVLAQVRPTATPGTVVGVAGVARIGGVYGECVQFVRGCFDSQGIVIRGEPERVDSQIGVFVRALFFWCQSVRRFVHRCIDRCSASFVDHSRRAECFGRRMG